MFDSTAFDAQHFGALDPNLFANQTVNKTLGNAYELQEIGYLAKHIDGGITVSNRNQNQKRFTSETRIQKTEHEGALEQIHRKSSLPSIGSEVEIDKPLEVVSH